MNKKGGERNGYEEYQEGKCNKDLDAKIFIQDFQKI
jgi:hypothetical protein